MSELLRQAGASCVFMSVSLCESGVCGVCVGVLLQTLWIFSRPSGRLHTAAHTYAHTYFSPTNKNSTGRSVVIPGASQIYMKNSHTNTNSRSLCGVHTVRK